MPSEDQQSEANLQQPWKQWHGELKPMSLAAVREGTLVIENNNGNNGGGKSGNHGTTALEQKQVDLNAPKTKPADQEPKNKED